MSPLLHRLPPPSLPPRRPGSGGRHSHSLLVARAGRSRGTTIPVLRSIFGKRVATRLRQSIIPTLLIFCGRPPLPFSGGAEGVTMGIKRPWLSGRCQVLDIWWARTYPPPTKKRVGMMAPPSLASMGLVTSLSLILDGGGGVLSLSLSRAPVRERGPAFSGTGGGAWPPHHLLGGRLLTQRVGEMAIHHCQRERENNQAAGCLGWWWWWWW